MGFFGWGLKLGVQRARADAWPPAPEYTSKIGSGNVVGEYDDDDAEIELTPDLYAAVEVADILLVKDTGEQLEIESKAGGNTVTVGRGHGGTTPAPIPPNAKARAFRPWEAPVITSPPQGGVSGGEPFEITGLEYIGFPAPKVQWQVRVGDNWVNIPGATGDTVTVNPMEATEYRAYVFNQGGYTYSDEVTVAPASPLVNPDTFTGVRANFGFVEGDVSVVEGAVTAVAGVGIGELDTGDPISLVPGGTGSLTWAANPLGNARPGVTIPGAARLETAGTGFADVLTAGTKWVAVVARLTTVAPGSATPTYNSDAVFKDASTYVGLHVRSTGEAYAYNWDGNEDAAEGAFNVDQTHLFVLRHKNGKIGVSINGGAFVEADSGDTQVTSAAALHFLQGCAGVVQRIMLHDQEPDNAADIVTALLAWYGI